MEEFGDPAAFEADPDVDLDEDMDHDALELGDYEADGGEEELDEHDVDEAGAGLHFDPIALGLKEINNLARCRVSTFKPGNGVKELLDDDLGQYWQYVMFLLSSGPGSLSTTQTIASPCSSLLLTFFPDLTACSLIS